MSTPTPAGRIFTYARVNAQGKAGSRSFSRWSGSRGGPGLSDRERNLAAGPGRVACCRGQAGCSYGGLKMTWQTLGLAIYVTLSVVTIPVLLLDLWLAETGHTMITDYCRAHPWAAISSSWLWPAV